MFGQKGMKNILFFDRNEKLGEEVSVVRKYRWTLANDLELPNNINIVISMVWDNDWSTLL